MAFNKLVDLLCEANLNLHFYENDELKGAYYANWHAIYATFLYQNGFNELINRKLSIVDLGVLLNKISKEYKSEQSQQTWIEYLAQEILKKIEFI